MSDDWDEDPDLGRALGALPREISIPGDLEERTVAALRRAGLLRPQPASLAFWARRLVAAAILLGSGYLSGAWATRHEARGGPRYLLLLREDVSERTPVTFEAPLVEEYRQWAVKLRGERRLVLGEELEPEASLLPRPSAEGPPAEITGFFIITAADDEEARAIAETCPHLRHGGRIEIRRIQPT